MPRAKSVPSHTTQSTHEYTEIPLALIDTEGQSVRAALDDDHVVELAMSISRHGLLEPIVVRPLPNGRYQLEAGFHRLVAFWRLKRATIPAHVRSEATAPIKGIALVENICRKDMSLEEEIDAVCYLHEEEGLSPSQICDLTGKSRTWVDRRLGAKHLPDDLKTELFAGTITLGHAEELARIADAGARRYATYNVIQTKLTVPQTRDLVSVYLSTPSLEAAVEAGYQKALELQAAPPHLCCQGCGLDLRGRTVTILRFCDECFSYVDAALRRAPLSKEEEDGTARDADADHTDEPGR